MFTLSVRKPHVQTKLLTAFCLALALTGGAAQAYDGEKLAKDAKLSISDARTAALKLRPGAVTSEELEKEKGGSGLRYSFDIKDGKTIYEVGIDANTGEVLENGTESKAGAVEDAVEGKVKGKD